MGKVVLGFLAALVSAYVVAVLGYSQLNLGALVELGMPVTGGVRFDTFLHDLVGMTALYLPILAVALLIGFAVAAVILRWTPHIYTLGYISAGFVAVFVVDFALQAAFGTHPIAVTRTLMGLLSQCLAGALGGYIFSLIVGPSYRARSQPAASRA